MKATILGSVYNDHWTTPTAQVLRRVLSIEQARERKEREKERERERDRQRETEGLSVRACLFDSDSCHESARTQPQLSTGF